MTLKRKKLNLGPIGLIVLAIAIVSILSLVLSLFGFKTSVAEISNNNVEMSIVSVKNIISLSGISYLLTSTVDNFKLIEPITLFIISLISVSALEYSGILNHIAQPIRRINSKLLTFIVIFIGSISTLFGDYSYVILIPFIGTLYKYLNKNPIYGIMSVFIGIISGYGTGIIYDYNYYLMGLVTEKAASIDVDKAYTFNLLSNYYIMVASTFIISIIASKIINKKLKKFNIKCNIEHEFKTSNKGLLLVNFICLIFMLVLAYGIIPLFKSSGFLLDKDQTNYVAMLFSNNAPFKQGFMIIILLLSLTSSFIYGKISGNFNSNKSYDSSLCKGFKNIGYAIVLLFFAIILIEILDWTKLTTCLSAAIITGLSNLQFSGLLLIIIFYISVLLISFLIPDTITKWNMLCPTIVPLFMKSNISPEFTQFIFGVADGIGKSVSPLYLYFIIFIGFLIKYYNDDEFKLMDIIKKIYPIIILVSGIWLLLLIIWYIVGLPLGMNSSIIM